MSAGTLGRVARLRFAGLGDGVGPGLVGRGDGPSARAQAPAPAGEANGTIAFVPSPAGGSGSQMLYLIDTKDQAFAVYRVEPPARGGRGPSSSRRPASTVRT